VSTTAVYDPKAYAAVTELRKRIERNIEGKSGFARDRSIALTVVNAGHGLRTLVRMLRDYSELHPKAEARSEDAGEAYARKLLDEATDYAKQNPAARARPEVVIELADRLGIVEAEPRWHGRTGGTDLEVLRALYGAAMRGGTFDPTASLRQLAEATGRQRQTVAKALGRLVTAGYLRLLAKGKGDDASQYRLLRPLQDTTAVNEPLAWRASPGSSGSITALPEVFRPPLGLGPTAYRIWQMLDQDERLTARQLATATGLAQRTVSEALLRLLSAGLAMNDDDGGWQRYEDDLDELAEAIGIGGHLVL
jgi:DNA-binding transcriptional ArsR family regulator